MRVLANILWHFPFCGFMTALTAYIVGGLFFISVIGAPIGLGLFQFGKFLLAPFSYSMVSKKDLNIEQNKAWKTFGIIATIIYIPFGLALCVLTIFQIAGLCITIIGIPVAVVLAKSLGTYFNPVNKKCVPVSVAKEIDNRKSQKQVNDYLANN
ncbi:MAG TPA: YccF domain-containing protein [Candidatus Cloacimonas acidaminovorans]|jgi:uncharacterized membrane protein YccF (DUF307 family)|nr:hypothetical protein [Candidatus Cloacimonas sp.]MDY0219317.1 YccF domain-containing protein [Candidatus Cloacimonas acidaminovorans]HOT39540.1 YccF domain-containing protein [Candidatus Cloacimonas acidaminovorans]HPI42232.1 YccF domain-containing protein [Candidatus Cloacimonas acidaminovorans]HQJ17812.1 YccF domain-containing protein [Candidatus Cloacimonas acidaminovorans]